VFSLHSCHSCLGFVVILLTTHSVLVAYYALFLVNSSSLAGVVR
jgi:hypothetical protein